MQTTHTHSHVAKTVTVEIRSQLNDNVVISFEKQDDGVNPISAGFDRICKAFGINRVDAESRYYVQA